MANSQTKSRVWSGRAVLIAELAPMTEGNAARRRIHLCCAPFVSQAFSIPVEMVRRPNKRLPESEDPLSLCRMQDEYQDISFQTAVKLFLGPDSGELDTDSADMPVIFLVARGR